MQNFPERLKEERKRLGYTQTAFGAIGDVVLRTQMLYEKGRRAPDARYLQAIHRAGADVLYILTGERNAATPATDLEARVLALYRSSPPKVREGIRLILQETARPRSGR
uniref:Helix-turn-helix domain-containing protein n=1 Tax=Candidatus Kentrum sp. LFY TaxID=2126342 RepID=A0A450WH22_9GAMM|nr:MAG: hypothetical protein BECKLFY1418C_GA0070996_102217 [Candidatus Kentron sp. LFY]